MDLELVNRLYLLIFVVLLGLASLRVTVRYFEYKREGLKIPALLPRDFWLFNGLGIPFTIIFAIRAFGIVPAEQWWYPYWIIGSGAFAIAGVGFWVYYEYFKVEK